jgi:hypothetical protein
MHTGVLRLTLVVFISTCISILSIYFMGLRSNEKQFVKSNVVSIISKVRNGK